MNTPKRTEYELALNALQPVLKGFPKKIIAIDGLPCVGKTTLGRFLAWSFNVSLIETDLFLVPGQGDYIYREGDFCRILETRLRKNLPVIVDGIVCLRLIQISNLKPDFRIHVTCAQATNRPSPSYESYIKRFSPIDSSDLVLELPVLRRPKT